VKGKGKLLIKF